MRWALALGKAIVGGALPAVVLALASGGDALATPNERANREARPRMHAWAPPWHESAVPLPAHVQSVDVEDHDVAVWFSPHALRRRGATAGGSRFAILGTRKANGRCQTAWLLIGSQAWLCGEHAEPSALPPQPAASRPSSTGLPYDYYFVGPDGAFAYATLALAGEGIPDSQLEPGFAIASRRFAERLGERFALTTNGLWIAARDLTAARPSAFEGVHLGTSELALSDVAWVIGNNVVARESPAGRVGHKLPRLTLLTVAERKRHAGVPWLRTHQGAWVKGTDLASATLGPWPDELKAGERWIDIDLNHQVLTAFEERTAVFVTPVSTGRGEGTSPTATPRGEHHLWVKLAATDMTNLQDQAASRFYAMEAVPWVMFFKGGYGLHGVFWHDDFGTRRSHGCVNLSPKDAAFLFAWTSPELPEGWHAVHPTGYETGTRIRVR